MLPLNYLFIKALHNAPYVLPILTYGPLRALLNVSFTEMHLVVIILIRILILLKLMMLLQIMKVFVKTSTNIIKKY